MRDRLSRGLLVLVLFFLAALAIPAQRGAAQGGPDPEEPKGGAEPADPSAERQRVIDKAVKGLAVTPSLSDGAASTTYEFTRQSDREYLDWVWLVKPDRASPSEVNEGAQGYSVGAGSRNWGKVVHKVEYEPPCSIDLDFMCDYNGASSCLLVTLCEPASGKGLAVDWGRQLVRKAGKPAKVAGPSPRADLRSGRDYKIHVEVTEGEVVASMNGVETVRAPLTEKERAPGRIGFEIHDARVILRSITVQGKVSMAWAEKEASKGASKKPKAGGGR